MRTYVIASTAAIIWLTSTTQAQSCLLYKKFDRGSGSESINYGSAAVASTLAKGSSGPSSHWVSPGKYGSSMLSGSMHTSSTHANHCDTGFTAGFSGDFTVHWWMKEL